LSDKASPCIARGYIYLFDIRALVELPYQRMFSGSTTDDQNPQ